MLVEDVDFALTTNIKNVYSDSCCLRYDTLDFRISFTAATNTKQKPFYPALVANITVLTFVVLGIAVMLATHFANLQSLKLSGPFRDCS